MEAIQGSYIIINGKAAGAEQKDLAAPAAPFYEVIRMIRGVPLFMEEHLLRFSASVKDAGIEFPSLSLFKKEIHELARLNRLADGNIKLTLSREADANILRLLYFVPHSYPGEEAYRDGVRVKTFRHTRPDPSIKKWDANFRKAVNSFIRQEEIFEAILLDESGYLTEGSRSNIFFIDEVGCLLSSPEGCALKGITRLKVEEICKRDAIPVSYEPLSPDRIRNCPACFLTGTSPKIMPVRSLEELVFDPNHPLVRKLMDEYNKEIESYIRSYRKE